MKKTKTLIFIFLFAAVNLSANDTTIIKTAVKPVLLTGFTHASAIYTLSSEVSGKIVQRNYKIGDVSGNKPLYVIDKTFINFSIRDTENALLKIKTSLKKINSRIDYLLKEFKRVEDLYKKDMATEVNRDAAENNHEQALLERETLDHEKKSLELKLSEFIERKKRYDIFAPFGMTVIERLAETGDIITPNVKLAKVADFNTMVIPLSVTPGQLNAIKNLSEIFAVTLDKIPGKATIKWINPAFDEATRKLGIELEVADYKGEKRGGIECALTLEVEAEGLMIDSRAISNRFENPRVKIKSSGETVNVIILREVNGHVIIADNMNLSLGLELESN